MGHVEPGGEAERPPAPVRLKLRLKASEILADSGLWTLWRELIALYPAWRSLMESMRPFGLFQSENQLFRFDVIQGLRAMQVSRDVLARLKDVDDATVDGVIGLAEVNVKRQEHFFRSVILAYVTIPLTVGAIWAQLSPSGVSAFLAGDGAGPAAAGGIAGLATIVLVRFVADWRAKAFLSLLLMARIERAAGATAKPASGRRSAVR